MIENPTQEQLRTLTNIVYLITNLIDGRNYVGMTIQTFWKRYCAIKWWTQVDNGQLRRDITELGVNNFKVSILEHNINDFATLNNLEDKYALKYNSYYPNGYNIAKCGKDANYQEAIKRGIEILRQKMKTIKREESYDFIDPEGKPIRIENLEEFCKVKNLNFFGMIDVFKRKRKHCKGYSNPLNPIKFYEFVSPIDLVYRIREEKVCEFSISQGLRQSDLCFLTRKQCKIYNGWRLLENKDISPIKPIYRLKSPNEVVHTFSNITHFSKKFQLDVPHVVSVLKGKKRQTKSWSLPEANIEPYWLFDKDKKLYKVMEGYEAYFFCQKHHLTLSKLMSLARRDIKEYRGWTLGEPSIDYQI